jgi:DNA relaxase NicK
VASPKGTRKVTGAGLDWLTVTARDILRCRELSDVAHVAAHSELELGHEEKAYEALGYRGWRCGQVAFGTRSDGAILRLSGGLTNEHWRAALHVAENVTRVDVAVDVLHEPASVRLGREAYRAAARKSGRNGRPPLCTIVASTDGGQTTYVGSRSSECYGRLYDKGREQKTLGPGEWWRYEVEFKGDAATWVSSTLQGDKGAATCLGIVRHWFSSRGVDPPPGQREIAFVKGLAPLPDDDRRLKWLREQVRPTVRLLLAKGMQAELQKSLGLPDSLGSVPNVDHHPHRGE